MSDALNRESIIEDIYAFLNRVKNALRKVKITTILAYIVGLTLGIIWILPIIGIIMVSIRPIDEVLNGWWRFDEFHLTLDNYIKALNHPTNPLSVGLLNSFLVAIPATILPIIIGAMAAYGFARYSFKMKTYLFIFIVILMAVPQQMVAIPLYLILVRLGLINHLIGLIIVHIAWGLSWIILFFRNYFSQLPIEIEEAARVDGASDIQIFFQIVLPVSIPALLSVTALQFTWVWNDFFFALLIIYSPNRYVATQMLAFMKGRYLTPWGLLSAGAIMVMMVPVVIYLLLQQYYVKGMVGWVIKG